MTTIATMLLTTAIMTITTSTTTTAMVMMALLLLLQLRLRLWQMILGCYTEAIPVIEQMRAYFYVRFYILVVFVGLITTAAGRWIPAATIDHRSVCTCTFYVVAVAATAATAIQSIRLASLFVVDFHIS